jgi:hypothetical protein
MYLLKRLLQGSQANDVDIQKTEYVSQLEVLVTMQKNYIAVPTLETGIHETRIYKLLLPPLAIRSPYRLRLLSNLNSSQLELKACDGENHSLHHECFDVSPLISPLPIPDPEKTFKIQFRNFESPPSENRKKWTSLDLSMGKEWNERQFLLLKVKPNVKNGFLFADCNKEPVNVFKYKNWLTRLPIIPIYDHITPASVLTEIHFPHIRNGIIKYRFAVSAGGLIKTFPIQVIQQVANEFKPLRSNGSLVSIYPPTYDSRNFGLIFNVWADPQVEYLEMKWSIDYLGSLSNLTGHYRGMAIALVFCSLILAYALSAMSPVENQNGFVLLQSNINYYAICLTLSLISCVHGKFEPEIEYLIGAQDLMLVWYFPFLAYFAAGIGKYLSLAWGIIIYILSFPFGKLLGLLLIRRVRLACAAGIALLSFFSPTFLVEIVILIFSLFICCAFTTKSQRVL